MTNNLKKKSNKWQVFLVLLSTFSVLTLGITIRKANLSQRKTEACSVLNFPYDHGQHSNFAAEWWYLNLLARTTRTDGTDEKDLGYVISFSRIAGNNGLLSSRYDNKTKSFRESTNTGGGLSVSLINGQYLFAQYSNALIIATLEEKPPGSDRKKVYKLTGRTSEMGSLDLTLKERTVISSGYNTPLLWGGATGNCRGKISVFGEDDTFYYSIPDLDITGTITDVDGVRRNVKIGKAWMDHQWFNSIPPSDWKGHYWTSFHLTYSSNLYDTNPHQAVGFVTQIYSSGPRYTYWVKRNADGTNECGVGGKITVNSYSSTNYPSSWKVELNKSNGLFLQANGAPFSDNQIFRSPSGPQFFEPASFYSGSVNGQSFTGLGFFETHLNKSTAISKNNSTITLRANGTTAGGAYPNMDILIDDKPVKSFTVSGSFVDYTYNHPFAINAEQVKVKFPNDYYKPPKDRNLRVDKLNIKGRNLRVDKLNINGKDYQTEASTTFSTGTWNNKSGCSGGYKQSEWLHCNGYFHYLANFY